MKTTVVNSNIHVNNVFFPGDVVEIINHTSSYFGIKIADRYKVKSLKIKPNLDNGQREIAYELDCQTSDVFVKSHSIILYKRPSINWLKYFLVKLKGKHTLVEVQKESEIKFPGHNHPLEDELRIINNNPKGKEISLKDWELRHKEIRQDSEDWIYYSQLLSEERHIIESLIQYPKLLNHIYENKYFKKNCTLIIIFSKINGKTHKEVYYVKPN